MKINLPFIHWSRISNDKRLVLSVVVFTLSNLLVSSGAHLIYRVLFFILALLIIKAMKSLTLRFILAFPFTLLTAADISISLYSWCTFGTTFNDGFAMYRFGDLIFTEIFCSLAFRYSYNFFLWRVNNAQDAMDA